MPVTIRNTRNGNEKRLGVGFYNHITLKDELGSLEQYTDKRCLFTHSGLFGNTYDRFVENLDLHEGDQLIDGSGNTVYIYNNNGTYYVSNLSQEHFYKKLGK